MKTVTLAELQKNIDQLLDEILKTGIPIEVNKDGQLLKIIPINKPKNSIPTATLSKPESKLSDSLLLNELEDNETLFDRDKDTGRDIIL
ncbi:MAG: hypothetical protein QNJ37_14835 [Crocosphaera sp.]|nr:hypothetical protein [Crocosphaera sp.]